MSQRSIYTMGYAGFDHEGFLAKLQLFKVAIVVDVRENPVSRNRDFTQSRLKPFLEKHGIEYLHVQELGVPTEYREELKANGDLKKYFEKFRRYLGRQKSILGRLYNLAAKQTCCLLCLEKRADECHRSVVAESLIRLNGQGLQVHHV